MKKITARVAIESLMDDGYLLTSHQIARMTSYSPQHINSVLKNLWWEGKVVYTVVPHAGRSKFARKWCAADQTYQHGEFKFVEKGSGAW